MNSIENILLVFKNTLVMFMDFDLFSGLKFAGIWFFALFCLAVVLLVSFIRKS